MRRATLIDWFKRTDYREGRGWAKGTLRHYDDETRTRVIAFKQDRIEQQKYFQGAPYVQMDYAKRYPQEPIPSLWFINECVRQAGLQTHAPKKRSTGHDTVKQRRFPIQTIVGLGRIQQACDFVGKKYIHGSPDAISIFSTGYYQWLKIYQIWRTLDETTDQAIGKLCAFWSDHPIPHVMRIDNAMTFRGGGKRAAAVSRFLKFLLNCNITPLFAAPYRSYTNPHIEGHNRTFTEKLWARHSFTTLDEIDRECACFNAESEEFYRFRFAQRLAVKHLRYRASQTSLNTQTLATTRGKRICFIRFVESWKERNNAIGIVVLERFIEVPGEHLNHYVFASLDLHNAILLVTSEHDGRTTELLKINFPYSA